MDLSGPAGGLRLTVMCKIRKKFKITESNDILYRSVKTAFCCLKERAGQQTKLPH